MKQQGRLKKKEKTSELFQSCISVLNFAVIPFELSFSTFEFLSIENQGQWLHLYIYGA